MSLTEILLGAAMIFVFVYFFWDWWWSVRVVTTKDSDPPMSGAYSSTNKWYRVTDLDSEPIEVWKQVTNRRTQYRLTAAGDGPNGRGEG